MHVICALTKPEVQLRYRTIRNINREMPIPLDITKMPLNGRKSSKSGTGKKPAGVSAETRTGLTIEAARKTSFDGLSAVSLESGTTEGSLAQRAKVCGEACNLVSALHCITAYSAMDS